MLIVGKTLDDLCTDENVSSELRKCISHTEFENEETLVKWLNTAPSLTTLRVVRAGPGRKDPLEVKESLENFIAQQCHERGQFEVRPKISFWDSSQTMIKIEPRDAGDAKFEQLINGHIIVDQSCGSAVLRGADIYVKGILGMSFCVQENDFVDVMVDMCGTCRKGTDASSLNLSSSNFIKIGSGQSLYSRDSIFKSQPEGVGVRMINSVHPSLDLPSPLCTALFAQNYPSFLAVQALRLQETTNCHLLDMCSSPGGKTLHAAELVSSSEGTVLAVDKSPKKIETLQKNLDKYGVTNVKTMVSDGRKLPGILSDKFERVLVDAPCSALGKRACLKIRLGIKELLSYPKLQKHLLDSAIELLKPGGFLVFSTCTIAKSENEDNVSWLLDKYKGVMELDKSNPILQGLGYQRFSSFDHIGFFVAAFKKIY